MSERELFCRGMARSRGTRPAVGLCWRLAFGADEWIMFALDAEYVSRRAYDGAEAAGLRFQNQSKFLNIISAQV